MRKLVLVLLTLMIFAVGQNIVSAAPGQWTRLVNNIEKTMNESLELYKQGDIAGAKKTVDQAYYGMYEKEGMEMIVNTTISSKRANLEEYKFSTIKKLMTKKAPEAQIKKEITEMIGMMKEDALQLDGGNKQDGTGSAAGFLPAFLIMLREGFEAILIIGAIIAYLIQSGNGDKTRVIYYSSAAAILASFLTAFVLQEVFSTSGASQELLEGLTMLVAVAVLLSVSYWMIGKAETKAWQNYIQGKVQSSLSSGNTWSLGVASFLAVYREGAEVVLFYQALISSAGDQINEIWLGFGLGCVALVVVFALVRYGSVRIPLKPFFWGTGILMYVLAISFAGSGMKELQEAGVVGITSAPGIPVIDLLGVYPTWETLFPQIVLILLLVGGGISRWRNRNSDTPAEV